jgi:hypothetical protein
MDTARLAGEAANQVESRRTGPYGVASQAKWDESVQTRRAGTHGHAQPLMVSTYLI